MITIYEARERKIPVRDIMAYDMSDEEKLVYIFENKKDEVRKFDIDMYYCLLGLKNKYREYSDIPEIKGTL